MTGVQTCALPISASVTFRVRVVDDITDPTGIANIAHGTAVAATIGTTLESDSNPAEVTAMPLPVPPITIELDPSMPTPTPGEAVEVPVVVENTSDDTTLRGVRVCIDAPPAVLVAGVAANDCTKPVAVKPGRKRTVRVKLTPKRGTSGHCIAVQVSATSRGYRPVVKALRLCVVRKHKAEPVTG